MMKTQIDYFVSLVIMQAISTIWVSSESDKSPVRTDFVDNGLKKALKYVI